MILERLFIFGAIIAALVAPTVVIVILARAMLKASARNPSTTTKMFVGMILMLIVVEGVAIGAVVMLFKLFNF